MSEDLIEIQREPRIFRQRDEKPAGVNCLRWIVGAGCWEVCDTEFLEPGDIYIPSPWLEDL